MELSRAVLANGMIQTEKKWLVCDSVKDAEASSILYLLVEAAKANGLDPYNDWLLVRTMLQSLGKKPSNEELEKRCMAASSQERGSYS